MVLSYYIATQTFEEHLEFKSIILLFLFFLLWVFCTFLEKQNATHSSSEPCLEWRDFWFRNHGPCHANTWLIPSTGRCLVYLQRERSLSGPEEGRGEERPSDAEVSPWFQWMGGDWEGQSVVSLQWYLFTNGNGCAWLCWPLHGSVHLRKFKGWVGQQWFPYTFSG